MLFDSKDLGMSSGITYHHGCVLDTEGIVMGLSWHVLETAQGVYNTTNVLKTLDYAAALNKPVILRIFYKSYGSTWPLPVPSYIVDNTATYGGDTGYGGLRINSALGYTPRFDNVNVMARFKDMIAGVAAVIANHSALQGMGFDESAWSFAGVTQTGLTALQIRQAHREMCLQLQTSFPAKEIYPFYNYCDFSSTPNLLLELQWSWDQGMCAGMTDTHRLTDMTTGIQPVAVAYPAPVKFLMCVDYMSTGDNDSSLTERYLENARTTSLRNADITAWYDHNGASGAHWAATMNAISVFG